MSNSDNGAGEVLAAIPKNARERVQVSFSTFKGYDLLDMRLYYRDPKTEEWKPTPKGVTVQRNRETVEALRDALTKVLELIPAAREDADVAAVATS